MNSKGPIPQEWILEYITALVNAAERIPDIEFREVVMVRAQNVIDLLDAWVKYNEQ